MPPWNPFCLMSEPLEGPGWGGWMAGPYQNNPGLRIMPIHLMGVFHMLNITLSKLTMPCASWKVRSRVCFSTLERKAKCMPRTTYHFGKHTWYTLYHSRNQQKLKNKYEIDRADQRVYNHRSVKLTVVHGLLNVYVYTHRPKPFSLSLN